MRKKFTMLLASLFLVMGTAWAQVVEGQAYFLKVVGVVGVDNAYIDAKTNKGGNRGGTIGVSSVKVPVYFQKDGDKWKISTDPTFAGGFLKVNEWDVNPQQSTGTAWTIESTDDGAYRLKQGDFTTSDGPYLGCQTLAATVNLYSNRPESQAVKIQFEEAYKIELTTDESKPIWYTIKNVRGNVYAQYNGAGQKMQLSPVADTKGHLFYFTAGSNGGYKIHNAATTNKCADFASWNTNGIEWYIKISGNTEKPGLAISKTSDLTQNTAWNNEENKNLKISNYSGNDLGSTWAIERFTGDISSVGIKMSTNDTKYLYNIKNDRKSKFANYTGNDTFSQTGGTNPGSYWYFVEVPDVEGVPEGYKACYIYNAATDLAVQNHTNGFMSTPTDGTYPAKIYFVGPYEATYWGYVIYPKGSNNGWNDYAGSSVTDYDYKTDGSIWDIIPADKTEATLKTEAATAKTNALNKIALYEYADYYTYADDAIATAKTTVNAATNDNLKNALFGHVAINNAIATLEVSAKGTTAPAAGDIIQLKHKVDNKYLKANDADANNTDNQNDLATLWSVEAGDDGNVKLKNVSTNKYIGTIRKSGTVAMQADVANAAQFAWTNQTGTYAVFKDVNTEGVEEENLNYLYGHVNNGKLVGWEPTADNTQWLVSKLGAQEALADLQTLINTTNQTFGTAPGLYRRTDALTTALNNAQTLIDEESTEVGGILDANNALQTAFAEANASKTDADIILPEVGKYYRFSYDFGNAVGVKYVQAVASGVTNKANAMVMTDDQGIASIFYYDGGADAQSTDDDRLVSYSTGLYVNESNRGLQPAGSDGGKLSFETAGLGKLKIKVPNYFHANQTSGDNPVYYVDHCGEDGGHTTHNFIVEEVDMTLVTVKYMYKGAELTDLSVEKLVELGSTYTVANPYANKYVNVTCAVNGNRVEAVDGQWTVNVSQATSVIVTITEDLPFKTSTSFATANWQYLQMNSNNWKYMQTKEADNKTASVNVNSLGDRALWAFVGDAISGFKIWNKGAGEGYVLTVDAVTDQTEAYMKENGTQVWTIEKGNGGFIIRQGAKECLNDYANGGVMKIWKADASPTGAGSAFRTISGGVTDLTQLALPGIFTLQAERSPLLYDANAERPNKLSSGIANNITANANDINQQFMIFSSTTTGKYYLYSLGANKFVDADLNFTDYPEPVLSFEANNVANKSNAVYPWFVKIGDKYVVPGSGGQDGNKLHHTSTPEDDEGKRYHIIKVGEDMSIATDVALTIQHANGLIKDASGLSNSKVYTVSTYDRGVWSYNAEKDALWYAASVNPDTKTEQFAFLTVGGRTYLYSVGAGKFVVMSGADAEGHTYTAYSNVPSQPVEILKATGNKFFPLVVALKDGSNEHHIGISPEDYDPPVITFYNDLGDDGNKVDIRMAGNLENYEEIVAEMETYLTAQTLVPELQALIAKAEAALTYLLESDNKVALATAKTAAENVLASGSYTAETLGEKITALTTALNNATLVSETTGFNNAYVYTFVSKRGWMVATEEDATVKSANEGDADNALHQWAVYKSAKNNYYLYNIGKQQFMGFVNTGGAKIPFAETPQMTTLTFKKSNWADYPIMFSVDNVGAVNNDMYGDMKYWDGGSNNGWNNLQDDGNNHKVTIVGAIPSETLTAIENAVALFEAIDALQKALADADNRLDNALGYYSCTAETQTELDAIEEFLATATDAAAIDEKTARVNELIATFTLNKPQAGKFYRIKNNAGNGYLSSGESGRTQFKADIATDASSIFGYIDGKLLSYKNGMYIHNDGGQLKYAANPGEGIAINFVSSLEPGKLQIHYYTTENRYLYSGGTGNTDAGRDAENTTEARYRFTVEEVTTLPVTVTEAQVSIKNEEGESVTKCISTFYAPVALNVPAGVIACTGQVVDNYLALTAIESRVIPANTGVILLANAADESVTYEFSIHNGVVSGFSEEDNHIKGSVAKTLVAPEEGYNCYVLAQKDETVGLYRASLNKNASNQSGDTHFINNACKAYIPVQKPAVEEPAQAARALTMRFSRGGNEGTTSVEGLELKAQGSQLIYDLQGRRVLNPTKGMYIVNGKKVIVK